MGHPDIPGAERTTQVPQGAQFIIAAADTAVRLMHVRSPGVRDQAHGRVAGHGTPGRGTIERPDHLDGWQHRVLRAVGVQGEGLEKGRCKLPDGAIAAPKKVDGVIMAWPNQPGRLFDGCAEDRLRDTRKTDGPDGGIVNRGVEEHLSQFAEEPELLVGRAGDGLA